MTADDTRLALTHAYDDTKRLAESWAQFARSFTNSDPLGILAMSTASQLYQVLESVQRHPAVKEALTVRSE